MTTDNDIYSSNDTVVPFSINVDASVGRYYLDKLTKEEQKQEGRKRKFESNKLKEFIKRNASNT